jgi:hypothetical protein
VFSIISPWNICFHLFACFRFYDGLPVMDNFHYETVEHFRGVEVLADDVTLVTFP